jgi:hypothetical protein
MKVHGILDTTDLDLKMPDLRRQLKSFLSRRIAIDIRIIANFETRQ